jgi:hypothetical protein
MATNGDSSYPSPDASREASLDAPSRSGTNLLQTPRRPTLPAGLGSAPGKIMNGHFANLREGDAVGKYEKGIQVIDADKNFKFVFLLMRSRCSS